ncbi:hypothetical protein NIES2119_30135 [[Phormidium ambiguum] IAM M-71]|uniref:P/Homo B domain-containing protein n=1 Tax=[Phormidium ambiguum] IAM M-71 TaxID=454136 RepID=A0A1U7I3Y8_9CYAN|nr:S8 family serine peptidase [Phormidium ambiguum]OKH30835.1 hypothetical protein NIES2119_30135 [Phormidium ambiguum IAM M-71]
MSTFDIGLLNTSYQITDTLNSIYPSDIYNFALNNTQSLQLSLTNISIPVEWQLKNQEGKTLQSGSINPTNSEVINLNNLSDGGYTIELFQSSGDTNYTLGIDPITGSDVGTQSSSNGQNKLDKQQNNQDSKVLVDLVNQPPKKLEFTIDSSYKLGESINVQNAKVFDEEKNLEKVDFSLKAEEGGWTDISDAMIFSTDNEGWATFNYSLTDLPIGNYHLKASAYDSLGKKSNEVVKKFTVEYVNLAPNNLEFTIPKSSYFVNETVNLTGGKIYDENGAIDLQKVDFWVQKNSGEWQDISDVISFTTDSIDKRWATFDYNLNGLEVGNYQLKGIAYDQFAAKSNEVIQSFSIVNPSTETPTTPTPTTPIIPVNPQPEEPVIPPITIPPLPLNKAPEFLEFSILPLYTNAENLSFSNAKVYDPNGVSDIDKVYFWLGNTAGQQVGTSIVGEFTPDSKGWARFDFSYNLSNLAPGRYQLWAIAQDKAGNYSNPAIENFSVITDPGSGGLSDEIRLAIANSANIENYTPEQLAKAKSWVVGVTPGQSSQNLATAIGAYDWGASEQLPNTYIWEFPNTIAPTMISEQLNSLNGVEFAYPLIPMRLIPQSEPNDPLFANQWHLLNKGQTGGTQDADLNVVPAWNLARGKGVVIGVVDDGLQYTHPDLEKRYLASLSRDFNETIGFDGRYAYRDKPLYKEIYDQSYIYDNDVNPTYKATIVDNFNNVPKDISYNLLPLDVPLTGVIRDINVLLDIDHLRSKDLAAYLSSPIEKIFNPLIGTGATRNRLPLGGTDPDDLLLTLFENNVGRKDGSFFNFNPIRLDQEASTLITQALPPFYGSYQPQMSLSKFYDQYAMGKWNLTVRDNRTGISGKLYEFGLELDTYNPHGTAVAGLIAASGNNNIGGTGVAPEASLAGLRLIADEVVDRQISDAFSYRNDAIHIYNNSWKERDWLNKAPMSLKSLETAIKFGRNGLGNIHVFAGGNDKSYRSNVNYNGFANSRYAIAVGAIDHDGKQSWYSEPGAPLLVSAYSSFYDSDNNNNSVAVTTTDLEEGQGYSESGYTNRSSRFGGTSAAAGLVSGVVALMLDANPDLSWRDVQDILVKTARKNDFDEIDPESGWWQNGGGLWVNHQYGFGAVDAEAAVREASNANRIPLAPEVSVTSVLEEVLQSIPDGDADTGISSTIQIDKDISIEKVEVVFDTRPLDTKDKEDEKYWDDLTVVLTSPDGTKSILAQPTKLPNDLDFDDRNQTAEDPKPFTWIFTSARHWSESSKGMWELQVLDENGNEVEGYWESWKLNIYGTEPTVNVIAADANAAESGNDPGTFTFTRTGSKKNDLIVSYSVTGTATNGTDYNVPLTGTVTIPAGQDSVSVSITPVDDVLFEKDETVTVKIDPVSGYNIGTENSTTVIIAENDLLSEEFTDIGAALTGGSNSSVDWGDFDNDGDLDLVLAGSNNSKVYRNDNGNFTDIGASLTGVLGGSLDWGDYDNDGDLDILLTGSDSSSNSVSKIYRNDSGTFFDVNAPLTGVSSSSATWGDFDNDGDLDILLSGFDSSGTEVAGIYRNDNGSFSNIGSGLKGFSTGSGVWGDYDSDGDLDILLTGKRGSREFSEIYRNDNGSFTNINASLTGVAFSSAAWGDYDKDGDLDIVLTGNEDEDWLTFVSKVYRNDGGNFNDIGASLTGVERGSAAWGDYDNDGDLDILLTGRDAGFQPVSKLYRNDNGNFTDTNAPLMNVGRGAAAWGDYDKDGDLDIVLTGWNGGSGVTKVYKNNTVKLNTIPTTPSGLNASVNENSVSLNWNPSSDAETPGNALTYNLRVGTTPGGSEIVSPMANGDGTRKVAQMGNVNQNADWTLDYLTPGTYYWSVQAVDNNFVGSPFAKEGSFTVTNQPKTLLSIGAVQALIPEVDGSSGQFLISRRGDITTPLSVNYAVGGTAANGTDYQPLSGNVIIPAGSVTATIPIDIIDDTVSEGGEETVVISLNPDLAYDLGSPNSSTMTIYDGAIAVLRGSVTPL